MKKQMVWLIVGIALMLPACVVGTAPECGIEKGSNQFNPCSPIDEPAQEPTPTVGDTN
jgi:hypothetical protein